VEDISCVARNVSVLEIDEMAHALLSRIQKDPSNFDEAMKSSKRELWKEAIREKLNSMKINNVWRLSDRPEPTPDSKRPKAINSKWVFKRIIEIDGSVKYKARLVARGFKDINEYDLRETTCTCIKTIFD